MKLILAQGNPTTDYESTRHNIGFSVLDEFAHTHSTVFQPKDKFKAHIAELQVGGEKVLLAKPVTYYNLTGTSARALIDFYKLDPAEDMLVVHDELALPFGTIRSRERGSDGGNNGIKSLNTHIGENYKRARIGIGNDDRAIIGDTNFVLGQFTADEQKRLPEIIKKTHLIMDEFIQGTFSPQTHSG